MEINIIFAHELIQSNIIRVEPPLFPLRGIFSGDTDVANDCVELQGKCYDTV